MANIQPYQSLSFSVKNLGLINQYFEDGQPSDIVQLEFLIPNRNINVKELGSFLNLIYRVHGTLSKGGLRRYSHHADEQIHFAELRFGSAEFNFQELLSSVHAERLIVLWMFLKHIPTVVNTVFDMGDKAVKTLIHYEEYIEKRQKRRVRRALRDLITDDLADVKVDKKSKEKLVTILSELYGQNLKDLIPSSRFSRKYIKELNLKIKNKD